MSEYCDTMMPYSQWVSGDRFENQHFKEYVFQREWDLKGTGLQRTNPHAARKTESKLIGLYSQAR